MLVLASVALFVALVLIVFALRRNQNSAPRVGQSLGIIAAVPLGVLTYFIVSIALAIVVRRGYLFSVPFGGTTFGGSDAMVPVYVGASIIFWIFVWVLILRAVLSKRH
jgi:hypothetical protein